LLPEVTRAEVVTLLARLIARSVLIDPGCGLDEEVGDE
jgi:hypothetical protein